MTEPAALHSPLPWRVAPVPHEQRWVFVEDAAQNVVGGAMLRADAEFAVLATKTHADLLAALKECSFRLAALATASGDFSEANAKALDMALSALENAELKAEGRD